MFARAAVVLLALIVVSALAYVTRGAQTLQSGVLADASAAASGLLIAGGSLQTAAGNGIIAADLGSQRELGHFVSGGPTQGDALARSPDGRRAYFLGRAWLVDAQRAESELVELELPSLKVLRRAPLADGIHLLGRTRVIAVAPDGKEVYVETMRVIGPQRYDPELKRGQPDSEYGIATFDIVRGTFTRTMWLDGPWCGVAELFATADGKVAVLCAVSHQVRLVDVRAGREVGRIGVSGEMAELSPDRRQLWVVSRNGTIEEIDLAKLSLTRRAKLAGTDPCSFCLPLQRVHASAERKQLFVRAAPERPELPPTGHGDRIWIIDTTTLQRTRELRLPAAAFDAAPTPDGAFVLASTIRTEAAPDQATWLIDTVSGREVKRWPWALCCLEIWPPPMTAPSASADGLGVRTCAQKTVWQRPSEAEMARAVWSDNRYRDASGSVPPIMRAHYDRSFLVWTSPTGSGAAHAAALTGLGAPPPGLCGTGRDEALIEQREIVLWALGYRVLRATVAGDVLTVDVEPTGRGYHIVYTVRPTASAWTARFVGADGREVARWTTTDDERTARNVGPNAPLRTLTITNAWQRPLTVRWSPNVDSHVGRWPLLGDVAPGQTVTMVDALVGDRPEYVLHARYDEDRLEFMTLCRTRDSLDAANWHITIPPQTSGGCASSTGIPPRETP